MDTRRWLGKWKEKAEELEEQVYALYFAARDPRTPWYARALAVALAAYAFSPIDLIPDFIPILGYLDDLLILPLGALLAIRMIPPEVMAEARRRAAEHLRDNKPKYRFMIVVVVAIWVVILAGLAIGLRRFFH
jgi:uncharacterized membrane protein YkvA (DUF1232 family)